jgi:hypothetical protein
MLRALVLLFLLVNAGLWYWLQSDPQALQSDREPQRLNHQVSPDAVQVLPDLPASGAQRASAPVSAASTPASDASVADTGAAGTVGIAASAALAMLHKTGASEVNCLETQALNDAEFAALKAALAKTGLSDDAIGERRQSKGGAWIVYLGRYNDSDAWQQKAAELRKLDVKFDRVNAPIALAPGLSLGQFDAQADAAKRLGEVEKQGVHGARVAVLEAPIVVRHLQVHANDTAWRRAAVGQRFDTCPANPPTKA